MLITKLSPERKTKVYRTIFQVTVPALILFLNDLADVLSKLQGKYSYIAVIAGAATVAFAQNLKNEVQEQRDVQAEEAKNRLGE